MSSPTHPSNNFDCLRFLAATLVWYWHCYALLSLPDPFGPYIHFNSPGEIGVAMFFIISGYFVTLSYCRHTRFWAYMRNRALRIFPALAAVVLLSVFVLGPLVTTLALSEYFHEPQTFKYLRSILVFPLQYNLPGVFGHNPAGSPVNGSLWTLQHEVRLYIIVGVLGALGVLRMRMALVLMLILYTLRVYALFPGLPYGSIFESGWGESKMLLIKLASLFAGGAFMYLGRDRIPKRAGVFALVLLMLILSTRMPDRYGAVLFDFLLPYAVIYLGFLRLPLVARFGKYGDFSYGMYLYAYPVQQLVLWWGLRDLHEFMLASFSLTFFCAVLSWHFIEKPALAHKK